MLELFARVRRMVSVLHLVGVALFCFAGLSLLVPQQAVAALPPISGCDAINGGDLDLSISGASANNSLNGHVFTVGDVLRFNWSGLTQVSSIPAITIDVNLVVTFTSVLGAGSTNITITQANTDLFVAGNAAAGNGSIVVTCDAVGPPPPPPPPPPGGAASAFLDQNAASGLGSINGDALTVGTFDVADTPPALHCDEAALRKKVADLRSRHSKVLSMLDRLHVVGALIRTYESNIRMEKDADNRVDLKRQLEKLQREETKLHEGLGVPVAGFENVDINKEHLAELEAEITASDVAIAEADLKECLKGPPTAEVMYTEPARSSDPLGAFAAFFGEGGTPQDSFSFSTPLGYAGSGVVTQPGVMINDWYFWAKGSVSGLNSTAFGALNGRVDLGASRKLGSSITVGGFLGWDGGRSTNTTTGGTTASNAVHFGAFGSYRLPNDMVLALSGGGALGLLTSTIAGDSGTTATQRGFLSASLSGTAWSNGPWRITPSGSLFIGAEHQNAFTTTGGVAVPEQTITLGRAKVDALIGYALPTELPMELFATIGGGYNFGNTAPFAPGQLSGSLGTGLTVTQGAMHGSISATYSMIGTTGNSWSLSATIGGQF